MRRSFKIFKASDQGDFCVIPPNLSDDLTLYEKQKVILRYGTLSAQAKVLISALVDSNQVGMSKNALDALNIPEGISLSLRPCGENQFRLGPVIGILTFPRVVAQKGFRRYIPYARRIMNTGLLYVFSPTDIHPGSKTITGYTYNPNNKTWQTGVYPYPDVVLDRIYPNNAESHLILEKEIGRGKIFNKRTLINKLEFSEALGKSPLLYDFIPETKMFLQSSDLDYFLSKYPEVYLKPTDAMKGRGIVLVNKEGSALFCRYMDGKKPVSKRVSKSGDITSILEGAGLPKRPYIIQAAVTRMEYLTQPFNFRVMTVKNGSGHWCVPAIFSRVAAAGGFLTNNSAGAEFISLKDLFNGIKDLLQHSKKDFLHLLTELSIETAKVLDDNFGPLGKLGLDIVIDKSGKPWLIEANGNPGWIPRNALREYPAWSKQMYDYPIAYALYLAELTES